MKTPLTFLQGIILTIIIAVVGLVILILISRTNDFGLVEENYYEKDLRYQEQIERMARTDTLTENLVFKQTNGFIEIKFPAIFTSLEVNGEIQFYRPSDPRLDKIIQLKLDDNNNQIFDVTNMEHGAWIVKLKWSANDLEYYTEKRIFLNN